MSAVVPGGRSRFLSLDVFRGMTVFLMIVVNTSGPGAEAYAQMVHPEWFGFTLADLVFPSFLFAVGTAMSFALRRETPAGPFLIRILRRAGLIFLFGFLMYWYPFVTHTDAGWVWKPLAETRIPGVLQRIALAYAAAAIAARWLGVRGLLLLSAGLLVGYWLILLYASAPGMAFDKMGNAGTRLDLWLIGPAHLYTHDNGFDPEGLLGTLPAIVNVIAGYLTGLFVKRGVDRRTAWTMAGAGAVLIVAALGWSTVLPIMKKLWTGSYVLLTVGIDLVLLALLVEGIERQGVRAGTRFFTILGRNPLAIYLFSELLIVTLGLIEVTPGMYAYPWVGIFVFQAIAPGPLGALLCAVAYALVCWSLGWWLDRRWWILKV